MAEAFSDQRRIESETIRKAGIRLVPFLVVCYFIAYVDRVNVGFAALTMNKDLGLTATAFGTGAALFFVAYVIFEVPSNLALERFGARRWIARIMISWGLVGLGSAFVTGAVTFSIARFLLGAAEAGFFPGVILYLTYWFSQGVPCPYRCHVHGRDPGLELLGLAAFRRAADAGWRGRAARLAMAPHLRVNPRLAAWARRAGRAAE
jgi:MFS family permease